MKKWLIVSLLVMLASSQGFSQGFNSVFSPDGNYVMAVGDGGLVFVSTNAGASWGHFNLNMSNDLTDVFIVGNKCYITNSAGNIVQGDITTNSYSQFLAGGLQWNSVTFVDGNNGYVCGISGSVRKTTNGGNSWTISNNGVSPSDVLNSISFKDANNGVAVGDNGKIYITSDGGANWTSQSSGTTYNLRDVKYFSGGIIAVGEYGTLLVKTGAGAFTSVNSRVISDIMGVSGSDLNSAHLCGGGGFIRNNMGGSSLFLNFEKNPMNANLTSIHYYDANTGYAVSSLNKAIIKTTDGGASWALTGGTTVTYQWQTTLTASNGIGNGFYYAPPDYQNPERRDQVFICQGTKVYRSYDKGATWTNIATVSLGSRAHSFYVNPLDTNQMIASMDQSGGRIMRSTDYGQTWTQTWTGNLTSYGMPLEMDPNDPNHMVLGPDNSQLLKSTNFGLNWTTLSSTVFVSPCDITIHHGNPNLMLLGDSGPSKLWKSTDGGLNWSLKNSQGTSEVPMIGISQLDTNLSFHTVWSTGGVFRSMDQGDNYSNVTSTGSAWGCDIARDDPTAFSFVTYGRSGYLTNNTGANFDFVGSIGSANAGVLFLNKGEVLAQGTSALYKLQITYNVNSTQITVTGVTPSAGNIPDNYRLSQNYPNPFNPSTVISFDLPKSGNVKLSVFDVRGVEVATLVNGQQNAGSYNVEFDGSKLSSGVYYYRLETAGLIETKKMILVK